MKHPTIPEKMSRQEFIDTPLYLFQDMPHPMIITYRRRATLAVLSVEKMNQLLAKAGEPLLEYEK